MPASSAGILMYKWWRHALVVLLVHPGGPFWARKDSGAWSIPKGEFDAAEDVKEAALREFEEELGRRPQGALQPLGEIVQKGGKRVTAFALEGDLDVATITSNDCTIEWPPRSGKSLTFPEVDRAEWLPLEEARKKILAAQQPFLDRLVELTRGAGPRSAG